MAFQYKDILLLSFKKWFFGLTRILPARPMPNLTWKKIDALSKGLTLQDAFRKRILKKSTTIIILNLMEELISFIAAD